MVIDAVLGQVFIFVWSIVVVALGICGLFFRDKFRRLNIWWALKLYDMTGMPLFKTRAAYLRNADWSFLFLTLGLAAIIAGALAFLSLFNIHIIN
jgi:hypothetical protein